MATEAITNSILTEPTVVPATTTQDEVAEDFPHIRENQNVLIHMPSGNVKIVNLKRNTWVMVRSTLSISLTKVADRIERYRLESLALFSLTSWSTNHSGYLTRSVIKKAIFDPSATGHFLPLKKRMPTTKQLWIIRRTRSLHMRKWKSWNKKALREPIRMK